MENLNRRHFIKAAASASAVAIAPGLQGAAAPSNGLTATWVNQYTYVAPDLKKTRDWYHEVFDMQIGHEEPKLTHLWYGDRGDTLMIIRQAEAGEQAPRIHKFGFTVDYWDSKAVEAELKRHGLQPKSDTKKGFWFNDPEGNEIGVFARDYAQRPAPSSQKPALWKAVSANHIVALSPDYKKLASWYRDLLNLRQTTDAGRDVYLWFGPSVWIPTAIGQGGKSSAELKTLDHVAYTIMPYDAEAVYAELHRRKMIADTLNIPATGLGRLGPDCVDINNFKTQICDIMLVPGSDNNRSNPAAGRGAQGQRRP